MSQGGGPRWCALSARTLHNARPAGVDSDGNNHHFSSAVRDPGGDCANSVWSRRRVGVQAPIPGGQHRHDDRLRCQLLNNTNPPRTSQYETPHTSQQD